MVIVLEHGISKEKKETVRNFLLQHKFKVREIIGEEETILGAVGHVTIDIRQVEILPGVVKVIPISKPYKLASREFKKEDTVVSVKGVNVGGNRIGVIAGPCSVESREQIIESAKIVKASGAVMLRGGAYKPRTSPYSFQGLAEEGLKYLKEASEITGLPFATEVVSTDHVEMMTEYVDVFQIGARNMQNFELLKRVGATGKPVILKRGLSATIEEWLMAAEYLLAHDSEDVILCERGIRTFETYTRNTLDISAIPVVKKLSHLPVIVDPSHATGLRNKVLPVGLAAIAAGADGLIVEVHPNPDVALSDAAQTLFPEQFEKLMRDVEALSPVIGKEVSKLPERQFLGTIGMSSVKHDAESYKPKGSAVVGESEESSRQVAFQGEHGAYSEMALNLHFEQQNISSLPCGTFYDVFNTVLEGKARFGIVPIENSLAGSINENYDNLLQFPDIKIVGETSIRIVHSLIGTENSSLDTIKQVYSHPQALAQCARFLDSFDDWQRIPFYDTAGSVSYIADSKDDTMAAIANEAAAAYYGMKVLKNGIETNPRNYTRFYILARAENAAVEHSTKAAMSFQVSDTPGSLLKCMQVLADAGLNMKKLESRPILGKPWSYMFFVELELPEDLAVFQNAQKRLEEYSENLTLLGMYQSKV